MSRASRTAETSDGRRELARLVLDGPLRRRVAYAVDKDEFLIGRARDNDLVLDDPLVSRRHARIARRGGAWVIEDLDSRHGTFVEGRRIEGAVPVLGGARLRVGNAEMRFELVSADAAPTGSRASTATESAPALVGETPAIAAVRDLIARVASAPSSVLLLGESGTGKEIAARLLHQLSPRADKPFVVVNCPALPASLVEAELFGIEKNVATGVSPRPGRIREADGGTLFLDEIGDLELPVQAKLLRFLQEKKVERVGGGKPIHVDARVIAATHHDLPSAVAAGRFRLDLYYRLNAITINMPTLRDRREDIAVLVEHFLAQRTGGQLIASPAALAMLRQHDFPGNVRELEAIVSRAVLMADGVVLGPELFHLPLGPARPPAATGLGGHHRAEAHTGPVTRVGREADDTRPIGLEVQVRLERMRRGESFWEVVHGPFLRRTLPAEAVRALVEEGLAASGGSYRRMAARFGVSEFKEYKRLIDFLRHHGLRPSQEDHGPE